MSFVSTLCDFIGLHAVIFFDTSSLFFVTLIRTLKCVNLVPITPVFAIKCSQGKIFNENVCNKV